MRRIRFTIASLLIVVLFVAVGFAALRESNEIWDSGLFSLVLGILLVSILFAVHRAESRRAFWIGFALFGWISLVLSLVPSLESRLLTTKGLVYLDSNVSGRSSGPYDALRQLAGGSGSPGNQVENVAFTADGNQLVTFSQGRVKIWHAATGRLLGGQSGTTENFVSIGHSLFALLAGWFGGQVSRRLCRTSRAQEPSAAVYVEGTTL